MRERKDDSPMMKHFLVAAALSIGFTSAALAGPIDDKIKERQTCMKAQGAAMGVMVPVIKGEKPYEAEAIKTAIATMDAACTGWAGFWAPETAKGETLETWAKPEIWSDAKGFEAVNMKAMAAHKALSAQTDEASFKAAFAEFGASCKSCHEVNRRPKE
jgi:cytochrome c556